ncbi:MAG: hypothetical protein NUV52_01425 [Candidatus Roizmanbacteria bacterium]|nr:hypothetical protein [Candidatus Roizmanbacteria bacterium]
MKPIVLILIIIVSVGVLWAIWDALPDKTLSLPEGTNTLIIGYTKRDLARELGVSADNIQLVQSSQREWPDGCLGVEKEGQVCTQVITPGYQIILEADGTEYTYRTNMNGTVIIPIR